MNWISISRNVYSVSIHTVFLLILISLISIALEKFYYSSATPSFENSNSYSLENYSHMDKADINDLLSATWTPGYQYEEVLGFREKQRTTKYVNVNEIGFRSLKAADEFYDSLNESVWFLGGSTTFGYGVADNETIPAYLELLTKKHNNVDTNNSNPIHNVPHNSL